MESPAVPDAMHRKARSREATYRLAGFFLTLVAASFLPGFARAQPVLEAASVPYLTAAGRISYVCLADAVIAVSPAAHGSGGSTALFASRYGQCLWRFATAAQPATAC